MLQMRVSFTVNHWIQIRFGMIHHFHLKPQQKTFVDIYFVVGFIYSKNMNMADCLLSALKKQILVAFYQMAAALMHYCRCVL